MENQQEQTPKPDKFWIKMKEMMLMYANLYVNGAIMLIIAILLNIIVFQLIFHLSSTWTFIFSFIIFIGLSPLFSKLTIGRTLILKYFDFLERKFGVGK